MNPLLNKNQQAAVITELLIDNKSLTASRLKFKVLVLTQNQCRK
jgi:hypothetical protein